MRSGLHRWSSRPLEGSPLSDSRGYTQEPFLFYFPEGPNTIRLEARQESIFIAELILGQISRPRPTQR